MMSDWASAIVVGAFTLVAGGLGMVGGSKSATKAASLAREEATRQREIDRLDALTALYGELFFIHGSCKMDATLWPLEAALPVSAFEAAQAYVAGLPTYLSQVIYAAEKPILQLNARSTRPNPSANRSHSDIIDEIEKVSGTAWGQLERYLRDCRAELTTSEASKTSSIGRRSLAHPIKLRDRVPDAPDHGVAG